MAVAEREARVEVRFELAEVQAALPLQTEPRDDEKKRTKEPIAIMSSTVITQGSKITAVTANVTGKTKR